MKVRIVVPKYTVCIELTKDFVDDLLPLLLVGGKDERWCLQQRQTFNSLVFRIEETLKALNSVEVRKPDL